jgi:phosphate transport system permease protein
LLPWRADTALGLSTRVLALWSAALVLFIVGFLLREAWPVLSNGHWRAFFTSDGWYPSSGQFNLWPMLVATLAASIGAMLLALPLGLASAVFLCFHAPKPIANGYRRLIVLLAGIPSVVFGLWGLTVMVPLIAQLAPPGASLLAAILILALMVLPTVVLTSEAALAAVPVHYVHGAFALGLSRVSSEWQVVVPAARAGIASGALLAMGRALGETMAVLMVAGNVVQLPGSLFDSVRVLTANMALEMAYATGNHRASLFATGLVLMALVSTLAWWAHRQSARGVVYGH